MSIELASGDKLKGRILSKTDQFTDLLTDYGMLQIKNSDIAKIDYRLKDKDSKVAAITDKFAQSNERQIDVFYDPTGYTLDKGTLYVSGLSWGFGITDKFQVTSKWAGYFLGNFNLRPKIQLFRLGTLEKEHVFAVGGHVHTRLSPDKWEWVEQKYNFDKGTHDPQNHSWISSGETMPVYYGGYQKIGSNFTMDNAEMRYDTLYNEPLGSVSIETPDLKPYYEVFMAYTYSRARSNDAGRASHTFGVIAGKHPDRNKLMLKGYYAGAVDIRRNLILNYEVFWDPYYVEWWNRDGELFGTAYRDLSTTKPKKPYISPVHFDIGFIYAITDWLRFGIHFQPYIFGIYLKF